MSCLRRPRLTANTVLLALALLSPLACTTTDNRGAKRGAAGGALVGLTMGALTGDARLAAAGAVAGGVAGGAAGSMSDLQNERENERTQTTADAIAGRPTGAPAAEPAAAQGWDRLDDLVGNWRCSIWGLDAEGKRITADATWTGQLVSTRAVQLHMKSFDAQGYDDGFDAEFSGYSQLSYAPDSGYELLNVFSATAHDQRWIGERKSGEERYSFYYAGSSDGGVLGNSRSGTRIELRFVGKDVFLMDTYVSGSKGEEQIQSYRFVRTP